jgi:type II secretory pathway pseudopilin PulG
MNLRTHISKSRAARRVDAFTMVEIAIALGVIAFALVAIIGILPLGMQSQKDNREDTIVNQDARVLLDAIRSGGRSVASLDLGSYVVATGGVPVVFSNEELIRYLTAPVSPAEPSRTIVFNSMSGAIANRGSDLGFRYEVLIQVTNSSDFVDTVLSNQVYEVRMRFAWPVLELPGPKFKIANEAYSYKARALVSGTYKDGYFFAQHYWNNIYTNEP